MAAKEKHYTWNKWLDKCYGSYAEAEAALPADKKNKVWPVGFEYEEEAEAFRTGELDNYIREKHKPIDAAQYDAVIYADGSLSDKKKAATYGLIVFFKGETDPYIESGTLKDVDGDIEHYEIIKYNGSGNKTEERRENNGLLPAPSKQEKKGFASGSRQIAGELFGVIRALEVCHEKGWPKKLLIVYDCIDVATVYKSWEHIRDNDSVSTVIYKKCWQKFKDVDPHFIKVYSHTGDEKDKPQYPIDRNADPIPVKEDLIRPDEYLHTVYNDLVDGLAKAETDDDGKKKQINPTLNFNVFRVISDEFERFSTAGANSEDEKRKHVRKLINDVLNKSGGIYRPIFSKE